MMNYRHKTKAELIEEIERLKKADQANRINLDDNLLLKIAENYPNSYISIIKKDLTTGFTSGQEFKNQKLDPKAFIGLTLDQVFGEHTQTVKKKYLKTFDGEEQIFELFINDQFQLYKTTPLANEQGEIDKILVVVENISERKNTEIELSNSQKQLKAVFNNTRDLQLLVQVEGLKQFRVEAVNHAYINACNGVGLNISELDLVGETLDHLLINILGLDKNVMDYTLNNYQQAIDTNERVSYSESIIVNGNPYHAEITLSPIVYSDGKLRYVLYNSHDITIEKEALKSLMESEERFHQLFEKHDAVMLLIEPETGKIIDANLSAQSFYGYPDETLKRMTIQDINTYPKEKVHKLSIQAQKENQNYFVFPHCLASGEIRTVEVHSSPIIINKKQILFSIIHDITDRIRAEKDLLENEEKFRNLYSNSPYGIIICQLIRDSNGNIIDFIHKEGNQSVETQTGFNLNDLVGKKASEIVDTKMLAGLTKMYGDVVSTGETINYTQYFAIYDRTLEVRAYPMHGDIFIINFVDISDKIKAEKKLNQSEEKFRGIYEQSPLAIEIYDVEGKLIDVNQQTLDLFGIDDKNLFLGLDLFEDPNLSTEKIAILKKGQSVFISTDFDFEVVKSNNLYSTSRSGKMYMDMYAIPFRQKETISGYLVQIIETTERKNLEETTQIAQEETTHLLKLAEKSAQVLLSVVEDEKSAREEVKNLNKKLEQRVLERAAQLAEVNTELEAFSYSVSHDLRAPLRAVSGFVHILEEDYGAKLDLEGKRLCSVISESAEHMGSLIDNLLAFSRIGRTTMRLSLVNMVEIVNSLILELMSPKDLERVDFEVDQLPNAIGDPKLIRQVWVNLFSNALKFSSTQERAVIKVRSERKGDEVLYSICDNGVGFDMRYTEKLFGVFQRLHAVTEFEGTGVGLAITQRIILRHGGRIWAEGETDKGATFYFSLKGE